MGVKVWVWLSFHVLLWSGACVLGCGTPLCCHEGGRGGVCLQRVFCGTCRAGTRACPNTACFCIFAP